MENNWPKVRTAVGVSSVLTILFGVGMSVSTSVGYSTMYENKVGGALIGIHGFSIIIPGIIGAFVWCKCGCCNSRAAYITSAVFDSLGIAALIAMIALWSTIFVTEMLSYEDLFCTKNSDGVCSCPPYYYYYRSKSSYNSDRSRYQRTVTCNQIHDGAVALIAMWILGAAAIMTHFVLVIFMARKLKAPTPAMIIYAPTGQNVIITMNNQTYTAQGHGYPMNAQPQSSTSGHLVLGPQGFGIQGYGQSLSALSALPAYGQPGTALSAYGLPDFEQPETAPQSYGQMTLAPMTFEQPGGLGQGLAPPRYEPAKAGLPSAADVYGEECAFSADLQRKETNQFPAW